ncbi:hypothetical protein CP533_5081 [Ophiocordyceps camponoti-saundersi (nom. inval.)]|nr:hypothetical protein CP533_5081 [Ophiocordyceps camponoti-saundersi (nom. inval.)]
MDLPCRSMDHQPATTTYRLIAAAPNQPRAANGPFMPVDARDDVSSRYQTLSFIAANGIPLPEIADRGSCRCHGEGPCHSSITLFHNPFPPLSVWQFRE